MSFMLNFLGNIPRANAPIPVHQEGTVVVKVPHRPLAEDSLIFGLVNGKKFVDWTDADHQNTYTALQKAARIWEEKKIEDFIVIGKATKDENFHWEAAPYTKPSGCFWNLNQVLSRYCYLRFLKVLPIARRKIKQIGVLRRVVFQGSLLSRKKQNEIQRSYQQKFSIVSDYQPRSSEEGEDYFCSEAVIKAQSVFEGNKVRILYNYAPVGVGKKKRHFMIMPKEHRTNFLDLKQDEYVEAAQLAQALFKHFQMPAYLFHKTNPESGQTVPHWHLHVPFYETKVEEWVGKLTVFKNTVWGSKRLSPGALDQEVLKYRQELQGLTKKTS